MPRVITALALLLALAAPAAAQPGPPPIPVAAADGAFDPPAEITPTSGAAVYVPPATVAGAVYVGLDGEEPFDLRAVGGSKTAFVLLTRGLPAGKRYRFVGVASDAKGDLTRREFAVVIPGAPVPPKPPEPPTPPVPPPVNPYRAALKAAFDADPATAGKDDVRLKLVELYRLGADTAGQPDVTTTDVLRERLRRAAAMLAADQLVGLRTAIAQLLAPVLPLGQQLDDAKRRAAADLFRQIADALAW
jgi:hypothetical protein